MKIEVLHFAWLRERIGSDRETLDVSDGATVAAVANAIIDRAGIDGERARSIRFAVNESFVDGDHRLEDGDRLALIPPTSGG